MVGGVVVATVAGATLVVDGAADPAPASGSAVRAAATAPIVTRAAAGRTSNQRRRRRVRGRAVGSAGATPSPDAVGAVAPTPQD